MKNAKYFALALVLAFALIGAAYAAWTDTLFIDATVQTGYLDTFFNSAVSNDPGSTADPGQPNGLNVGKTEAAIDPSDAQKIDVALTNVYPGYNSQVTFVIENSGTIPVKVSLSIANTDADKVEVSISGITDGQVINPGASATGYLNNLITANAAQNADYSYSVTITAAQWNL